jgi:hypothetical protein
MALSGGIDRCKAAASSPAKGGRAEAGVHSNRRGQPLGQGPSCWLHCTGFTTASSCYACEDTCVAGGCSHNNKLASQLLCQGTGCIIILAEAACCDNISRGSLRHSHCC